MIDNGENDTGIQQMDSIMWLDSKLKKRVDFIFFCIRVCFGLSFPLFLTVLKRERFNERYN